MLPVPCFRVLLDQSGATYLARFAGASCVWVKRASRMIFDDQGRILLLEHVFRPDSGWGIPGGFLGRNEQPEEGLRRELREEIGIEVEDVSFLFVRTLKRPGQVEIYFRARAIGTPKVRQL